ncbi:MAG: hypothetical protein WBO46_10050 [Caldilineaceae bacterium]
MTAALSLPLPHLAERFLLRPDQQGLELEPVDFVGRCRGGPLAESRAVLGPYGAVPGGDSRTSNGDRQFVRISVQAGTTPEHIDWLLAGLAALLPKG